MSTPEVSTYKKLVDAVSEVLAAGKLRAQQAVERERLVTYHEAGRLIESHLVLKKRTAEYGEQLFVRLSQDLNLAEGLLHDALRLYRWHPTFHAREELGWTHYRILLRLPDNANRDRFEAEAAANRWPTRELEKQVRQLLPATEKTALTQSKEVLQPLTPLRGQIDAARGIDRPPTGRVVDLGFTNHARLDDLGLTSAPLGDILVSRSGPRFSVRRTRSKKSRFYTYLAQVERVIDGDTLLLHVQPIWGPFYRERVRLRGIDTPEMGTTEGERAKTFVEQTLSGHDWIAITSTKPDAYDRYLVDVFVPNENDHGQQIADRGRFLNQMLLDEGLARRVDY